MINTDDLLDDFAACAIIGILSNTGHLRGEGNKTPELVATVAYDYAEAMMAERKKRAFGDRRLRLRQSDGGRTQEESGEG
jgi:hypothetical protein